MLLAQNNIRSTCEALRFWMVSITRVRLGSTGMIATSSSVLEGRTSPIVVELVLT